jgi:hypothetical protein
MHRFYVSVTSLEELATQKLFLLNAITLVSDGLLRFPRDTIVLLAALALQVGLLCGGVVGVFIVVCG